MGRRSFDSSNQLFKFAVYRHRIDHTWLMHGISIERRIECLVCSPQRIIVTNTLMIIVFGDRTNSIRGAIVVVRCNLHWIVRGCAQLELLEH